MSQSPSIKPLLNSIVYGARGNSGVILSQFFKGFAECFATLDEAGAFAFAMALKRGVKCAYGAVSNPAEGTILTVLREASEHACKRIAKGKYETIDEIVAGLLAKFEGCSCRGWRLRHPVMTRQRQFMER